MIMSAMSTDPICAVRCGRGLLLAAQAALLPRCRGQRSQPELEREGMTEHRRGTSDGVTIGCHVIRRQYEAVVHITGPDRVLVDLVGLEIITRCARHHPVGGDLERGAAENAFATDQVAEIRLRRIVS